MPITFTQRLVESLYGTAGDKEFTQQAYDQHRALDIIVKGGKPGFKDGSQAGTFVAVNVNVKKLGITQGVQEGSEYSLTNLETGIAAQYPWKTAVTPLVFTDEELGENQARQQIVSTMKFKIGEATQDHSEYLNGQFINGTGIGTSSESLGTMIGTTDNGGLSVATYPLWIGAVSTTSTLSLTQMDQAIDSTMWSSMQGTDFLITTLAIYARWKDLSQAKTTIYQQQNSTGPEAGIAGLKEFVQYRGAIFAWDRAVAANTLYGVDSSKIRFMTQVGKDRERQPAKISPTQLAQHIPLVTRFAFVPLSRRAHFKNVSLSS